jgi:hypothetical protein
MAAKKLKRKKRAVNAWEKLSYRVRLSALMKVVQRLDTKRAMKRISPDVLRAGVGVRKLDGKFEDVAAPQWAAAHELTLVLYVNEKLRKVRKNRVILSHYAFRITIGKHRRTFRIPTDVRTSPGLARARAMQFATNVTLTATPVAGDLALEGTLCCRFHKRGATNPVYAMTCQHVACASAEQANLAPAPNATCWSLDANGGLAGKIGSLAARTTFGTTDDIDECLDGALVALQAGSDPLRDDYWSFEVIDAITDQVSLTAEWGTGATLYSRFSPGGISVSPPVWLIRKEINYKSMTACISSVVEYELLEGTSRPGDSGSAIVSSSKKLLAMHIAGVDNEATGYAIPIHLLMNSAAMGIELEIA